MVILIINNNGHYVYAKLYYIRLLRLLIIFIIINLYNNKTNGITWQKLIISVKYIYER
jgi:hypothetical protein